MADSEQWISDDAWTRVTDASLPDGVIALQDRDGLWWRYPLVEFGQ